MRFTKFKTKDFVIIGIITALYMVLFIVFSMVATMIMPVIGHLFVIGIMSLLVGGTVLLFLIHKVPKFGVITVYSAIFMLVISMFGMAYIPWILSVMIASILMDIICSTSNYQSKIKNSIGFGILQFSHLLGGFLPVWISAENYKIDMLTQGMSMEFIKSNIHIYTSYLAILLAVFTILCGFFGMLFGYKILSKHFKKKSKGSN